ncbi:MAG: hypothetical protein CMJ76_08140 [Planctomycetaceae bacterium]|nr:hypothetical protein [Planctomycetaceae bacterium]|tara:strand:+ start:440 stop:1684 length:1245 start_codon:yes stop_codon:yes gene_type:complete
MRLEDAEKKQATDGNPSEIPSTADPANAKEVQKFTHDEALTNCRLDPSGRYAFAGAEDFGVYRWDLETGEKVIYRGTHDSWVRRIDFSNDGTLVYTSGWDGRVVVWPVDPETIKKNELSVENSEEKKTEKAEEDAPQKVEPQTELVVEQAVRVVDAHRGFSRWVHAGPHGKYVATCGNDKVIRLWDARRWKLKKEFTGHGRHPYAVMIHPDGESLVSEDLMGEIFVWNTKTGQRMKELKSGMTGFDNKFQADMGGARDMALNHDGSLVGCAGITNVVNSFAGQQDPIICIVDWESQEITSHLRTKSNSSGVAWGVRFHPEGYVVGAIGNQNGKGTVEFWSLEQAALEEAGESEKDVSGCQGGEETTGEEEKKPREIKPFHVVEVDKPVRGIDFTQDGRRFIVACSDGSLRVYQM